MTITKAGVIKMVAVENGLSQSQSSEYVESILEIMKNTLAPSEDIMISGFARLSVKEKRECMDRNSATDDDMNFRLGGLLPSSVRGA